MALAGIVKIGAHTIYSAPTASQHAALRILAGGGDAWVREARAEYAATGREAARRLDVPVETHEADWQRYGRSAGPKRNKEMLELGADLVVAFLDARRDREGTRGTRDMVERAERAGVPVRLVTMT